MHELTSNSLEMKGVEIFVFLYLEVIEVERMFCYGVLSRIIDQLSLYVTVGRFCVSLGEGGFSGILCKKGIGVFASTEQISMGSIFLIYSLSKVAL